VSSRPPLVSRAAWPAWADTWATGVPRWAWFGGLLGAAWVTGSLWAAPRIGASTFIMTAFVGQLVGSLLLDGTGSFGFARVEINAARIGGVALVIAGLAVAELGRPR
jgi:transporter family-2 protein